jgi:hypothetical protein
MSTKLENLELEIAHFNNFKQYVPNFKDMDIKTVELLLKMGGLQISTLWEQALSTIIGCTVVSLDANDLSDGGDGKIISVRTSGYGRSYSAPVTNTSGKTGTLYVQAYERKQHNFYYFAIPFDAYSHIAKSSNIEIPFDLDGTPRRRNSCNVNWWRFELKNLLDFKNYQPEPKQPGRKTINANNFFDALFTISEKTVDTQR